MVKNVLIENPGVAEKPIVMLKKKKSYFFNVELDPLGW